MDHIRISGTEPSSVILRAKEWNFNSWKVMKSDDQEVHKQGVV